MTHKSRLAESCKREEAREQKWLFTHLVLKDDVAEYSSKKHFLIFKGVNANRSDSPFVAIEATLRHSQPNSSNSNISN